MANVRDLKKDVKVMVEQFIQECYVQISYSPPLNVENILDIIADATQLQNSIIKRLSGTPDRYVRYKHRKSGVLSRTATEAKKRCKDAECRKQYFNSIASDFYDGIVELTERLNSLSY